MIRPLLTSALLITLPLMAAKAAAYEEYIEVTGYGEAEAWPDYLQINMLVSAIDEDAETAKAMVDQSMNQALAVAGGFDIAEEDIRADRIPRQPRWEWQKDSRIYRGEQVSRNLIITLRDTADYTELAQKLFAIKNLSINNTSTGFDDPQKLQQQATKAALLNARDKATFMAETLDNKLDGVMHIVEQGSIRPQLMRMNAVAEAKGSAPAPMLLQKETVSASVQVRFELDEE